MDAPQLRDAVCRAYSEAARNPHDRHPFPVGRDFALSLGYPRDCLESLPSLAVDAFTGVSNVAVFAEIGPGDMVLDLGCGAGLDALVAARRTGATGPVVGADFSPAMIERAKQAAGLTDANNVTFLLASAERLPLLDASIDVVMVNGIFNLNPYRSEIFRELARVMRCGGVVFGAELTLTRPLPTSERDSLVNWFT